MKHEWAVRGVGVLLVVIGLSIRYLIAKRRFNRRAMTGAERFRSFESAWMIRLAESLCKWVCVVLLLFGIFLFLSASFA